MGFTVGDLRRELKGLPDETKIEFDGGLTFGRLKRIDEDEFVLLFEEIQAELSPQFRKRHPSIKVAFCRVEPLNEAVEETTVSRL